MNNPLTWLSRRRFPYQPLIMVEISKGRLTGNFEAYASIAAAEGTAPVLKSNAYGHGLIEVATVLEHHRRHKLAQGIPHGGMPFFVVDSYYEAIALRARDIHAPLLISGYSRPEMIASAHLRNVYFSASSLATLQSLENTERRMLIQLKIDTGMHRQGISPAEIDRAIELLSENPHIELHGLFSHLADAANPDPSKSEGQIKTWNACTKKFKQHFASLKYFHLAATDGYRYRQDIDANVARLGLGLYGLTESDAYAGEPRVSPVLSMKSILTGINRIRRDETVGYGCTYRAERDMTIATIPVGYAEGVDRRLSNKGMVGVGLENVPCPIVGAVSMNMTTIDVSRVPDATIGMPVSVISSDPSKENSMLAMAALAGTASYELAVHIPAHLKRIVAE